MKQTRVLSFLLAVVIILPQLATGLFAASDRSTINYIKPSELAYVENGSFDEEPSIYKGNLNYSFTKTPDNTWAYSTGAGTWAAITHETDSDGNKYLHVTSDATPSVSYAAPKIIPAGSYVLSMSLYVEDSASGNLSVNYTLYNGNSRLIEYTGTAPAGDGKVTVVKNQWTTVTIPLEFKEDTDFAFRFWGANNYRIDNVSIGNPSDVLIETADLSTVNTASNVSTLDETALPDGVWSSNRVTDRLTLVPGSNALTVKRNPNYAGLAEPNNIFYSFSEKLAKGEYRLSFELNSAASQNYGIQIGNANNGWPWGNANLRYVSKNFSGTNIKFSETFTVPEDNTFVAFKINPTSYKEFTIDNVKLEKASAANTIYENDFSTAAKVNVIGGTSANWHTNPIYSICSNTDPASTEFSLGFDQTTQSLKYHYTGTGNTPWLVYNFGNLPKGSYELSLKINSSITGGFTARVHPYTANNKFGNHQQVSLSITQGEKIYTIPFTVTDPSSPIAVRMWGPVGAATLYIDDLKLTSTNVYLVAGDDFTTAPNITNGTVASHSWNSVTNTLVSDHWNLSLDADATGTLYHDAANDRISLKDTNSKFRHISYSKETTLPTGAYSLVISFDKENKAFHIVAYQATTTLAPITAQSSIADPAKVNGKIVYTVPFNLTKDSNKIFFRTWGNQALSIDDFAIYYQGTDLKEWNEVTGIDYTQVHNTANANVNKYDTLYALRGKWVTNLINPLNISYDSTNTCVKFTGRQETIRTKEYSANAIPHEHYVLYGFDNTLTKGDYSVNVSLATYGIAGETYQVAVYDRKDFTTPIASTTVTAAAGTGTSVGATSIAKLQFNVAKDTDIVLKIDGFNNAYHYCAYDITGVSLYKLANPVVGFSSSHIIAQFDSDNGTYYMAVKNSETAKSSYINYSSEKKLRDGIYILSGTFRTTDPNGAVLSASIGLNGNLETEMIGTEWTDASFTFTLKKGVSLSNRGAISFDLDSPETFYFKDLRLVFVDELPKPALNSGIAMVLLKKMQGEFTDPWKQIGIN